MAMVLVTGLVALFSGITQGAALPQYAPDKHLGVASCASSQCHGAVKFYEDSDIRRNEYRTWSREDAHSNAYAVLKSKFSRQMAARLGLKNAHEAKVCLDCHADNVPKSKRGRKFQITDGVGCEACHGGGERWIESHAEKDATHRENVSKGLYPSEIPARRARLCLSCHLGDETKFATHELMAAGHPRLSFELDTFTLTQTHYDIDDDYLKRKAFPGNVETWAAGVALTANQTLDIIKGFGFSAPGLFPEIALFDCHACHHAMTDKRLARRLTTGSLPAGTIRLNDSSFIMLYIISKHVVPDMSGQLLKQVQSLHRGVLSGKGTVVSRASELDRTVTAIQKKLAAYDFKANIIRAIRTTILEFGGKGEFRDYSGAEQATMAVDLLTFAVREEARYKSHIDRLYKTLEKESSYRPANFKTAANAMLNASK